MSSLLNNPSWKSEPSVGFRLRRQKFGRCQKTPVKHYLKRCTRIRRSTHSGLLE